MYVSDFRSKKSFEVYQVFQGLQFFFKIKGKNSETFSKRLKFALFSKVFNAMFSDK